MKTGWRVLLAFAISAGFFNAGSTLAESGKGWQVFRNEKWGYELLYPSEGWKVKLGCESEGTRENVIKQRMEFFGPDGARIEVTVWTNEAGRDAMGAFRLIQPPEHLADLGKLVRVNRAVGGYPAILAPIIGACGVPDEQITVWAMPGKIVRLRYIEGDGGAADSVYKKMLSSFK